MPHDHDHTTATTKNTTTTTNTTPGFRKELVVDPTGLPRSERTRILLSGDGTAWLDLEQHDPPEDWFGALWRLRPSGDDEESRSVWGFGKRIPAHRTHRSYGRTPEQTEDAVTYMFTPQRRTHDHKEHDPTEHNKTDRHREDPIPECLQPLLAWINEKEAANNSSTNTRYNQIVVNWYEDNTERTPMHRDYTAGLHQDLPVAILTLNDPSHDADRPDRVFVMQRAYGKRSSAKNDHLFHRVVVPTTHGLLLRFSHGANQSYRHGVPRVATDQDVKRRISVSFRSYR